MSNIMLNGLGIVLSPDDNPGYLPGMNSGASSKPGSADLPYIQAYLGQAGARPS
jgi:hypothetical protein